jgi:hypothetical protein
VEAISRRYSPTVKNLTFIVDLAARLKPQARTNPAGVRIRHAERADSKGIGRLYFDAYGPGLVEDLDRATADIAASFDGEYGELWLEVASSRTPRGVDLWSDRDVADGFSEVGREATG